MTRATSAVRDAANGGVVLEEARRLGLQAQLLPSEEEARLGVLAVANALPFWAVLVVDQGGGSAQVSLMEGRRYAFGRALPLGALRLTEAYLRSDPPKKAEVKALEKEVARHLQALPLPRGLPLVAFGGNLWAIARLHQKRKGYPLDLLHGYYLPRGDLEDLAEDLLSLSLKARASLPGVQADRARTLPASLLFLRLLPEPHLLPDPRAFAMENLFRHYPFNEAHRERVKALALELFQGLAPLHGYGEGERRLLLEAAHLHDIGMHIGYHEHYKHGAYLVLSTPLFAMSHREQALPALLVRYHRRGKPEPGAFRSLLSRGDARLLLRFSALLRLAEILERTRSGRVRGARVALWEWVRLLLEASEEP
ncbi:MAG: exopolyphosphatase [Thermus aquaticus]|uniref:Ppx/GppA phosphatase family protein n=1 Tax=Thermus aquaticus TaxID=271 RepID=UPI003C09C984